ncbi:MAG: hypothetical protein ABR909_13165 [Candidatus Bathyarchaeia archaeon]
MNQNYEKPECTAIIAIIPSQNNRCSSNTRIPITNRFTTYQ